MTSIKPFTDMCDWELKTGSHEWPGPSGGTCINEAAIVAAGFAYKSISSASGCPPCFSPAISAYLIGINDAMDHAQRQKLMRFVTRLSGSADTPAVEQQRLKYIVIETVRRILSMTLGAAGFCDDAAACRAVCTIGDAVVVSAIANGHLAAASNARYRDTYNTAKSAYDAAFAAQGGSMGSESTQAAIGCAIYAVRAAFVTGHEAAKKADAAKAVIYDHCIAIAEGALAIGNQATDIDAALVVARMNAIPISKAALAG